MTKPLDELLVKALEVPKGPERDAWIAGACLDDPPAEAQLRSLIEAYEAAGAFMAGPFPGDPPVRS